jgi:hypothetical protein
VETDSEAGETVSVRLAVCVRAGLLESVTLKERGALATAAEGVPVITPAGALRVRPAGRVPLVSDQV